MPLLIAETNKPYTIVAIKGDSKVVMRLESLGICRGQEIEVYSSSYRGFVLKVKGSRIAIDQQLASRIEVVPA